MSGRRGIGGSDLAAVVAYYKPHLAEQWAKWATAADVWMRLVHNIERPRTALMQRGIDAEPRLRKAYRDAYGGAFREKPTPWVLTHPRFPFVSVSPDDVWRDLGPPPTETYVEYKSTSIFARAKYGDAESDDVPDSYLLQVQLGLEITGLEVGHLFVGFGRDFKDENGAHQFLYEETRRFVIHRDRELMEMALGYAAQFHAEHVATRMPPRCEPRNNVRAWKRLLKEQSCQTQMEAPSQS